MAGKGITVIATEAMTFDEAWELANPIYGWLTRDEGEMLWQAAMQTPDNSRIIEVGAFCGRSTRLLAATGRMIYTVDPLIEGMSVGKRKIDDCVVESLESVVDECPNVEWVRCKSTEAPVPLHAAMMYIDAAHNYPHPRDDFEHFRSALESGGIVAFHDYAREMGVTKSVHELIESWVLAPKAIATSMLIGVLR